ncbi:MAG: 3-dehydroquinate dehydratase-2 [Pseudohongiellaceae bacterium]|jgi:3-dehydroquinate dehydratase-2
MAKLLVLHGPNLNLLGSREPEVYGKTTLSDINNDLRRKAKLNNHQLDIHQSNAEHDLVEHIHSAQTNNTNFIIINPAAFTHTSISMRDALSAVAIPFIEVHLSNVHKREDFRKHSYFSDIAQGVISGFGAYSYELALDAALTQLKNS